MAEELELQRGLSAEIMRHREIKAGVITGSVGVGVAIFLSVFMHGLILSGKVPPDTAEILSVVWIAGVIPFLVGLSLVVNGLFVSKKLADISRQRLAQLQELSPNAQPSNTIPPALRSPNTTEFVPANFSVTEDETVNLTRSGKH
jgi:hypothetical protein